jgi:hypothetical protein
VVNKEQEELPTGLEGKASPTSFNAWLALEVKMTAYSSGEA